MAPGTRNRGVGGVEYLRKQERLSHWRTEAVSGYKSGDAQLRCRLTDLSARLYWITQT
jgi:hypothetical protein